VGQDFGVINDGDFRQEDQRGIRSFGESEKATDTSAIGKFGFGQKAVFHLCDASVVCAYGENGLFSTVVNPFLGFQIKGNVTREWEPPNDSRLVETDIALLRSELAADFQDRSLILWLPLRRIEIMPAPGMGLSSNLPSKSQIVAELARANDLRGLMAELRHFESIDNRADGETRCAVSVHDATGRLLGPNDWPTGARSFGGKITTSPSKSVAQFVGREKTLQGGRLDRTLPHQ
jgi:hypothetical protein